MSLIAKIARRLHSAPSEKLDGYENPELVEVIFQKTKAFEPVEPWPEIRGARTVLDFGGGAGLHYKQARLPSVRWAVVETPAMVNRATELSTDRLRFFSNVPDAAAWLGDIDVMHSNGALQYLPEPLSTLRELCGLQARVMLWKRVFLSDRAQAEAQASRLVDNGPGKISGIRDKVVTYTRTAISETAFLAAHEDYRLEDRAADAFRFVR